MVDSSRIEPGPWGALAVARSAGQVRLQRGGTQQPDGVRAGEPARPTQCASGCPGLRCMRMYSSSSTEERCNRSGAGPAQSA